MENKTQNSRQFQIKKLVILLVATLCLNACSSSSSPDATATTFGVGAALEGFLVFKDASDQITRINVAAKTFSVSPPTASNLDVGVGSSAKGVYADVYNYFGGDSWKIGVIDVRDNFPHVVSVISQNGLPTSAAVLNFEETILGYSVNELNSATGNQNERTYFYSYPQGNLIRIVENMTEPVFCSTGEVFIRKGDRIAVLDQSYRETEVLPIMLEPRVGSFSPSADCRFLVFEQDRNIRVYDRLEKRTWNLAKTFARNLYLPVFSPDGKWVAFFKAGEFALRYLHIVPFSLNEALNEVDDTSVFKAGGGENFVGIGRISWLP